MFTRIYKLCFTAATLLALSLAACLPGGEPAGSPPTSEPTPTRTDAGAVTRGKAPISSVKVSTLDAAQVRVKIQGNLPDACTKVGEVEQTQSGHTFSIMVGTVRPTGAICAQALVPFEETVSLDTTSMPAGRYTVDVNGVTEGFELK